MNMNLSIDGRCPPFQFQCYGGKCIPETWVCDGIRDCDESPMSVSEDEAQCGEGKNYFLKALNTA